MIPGPSSPDFDAALALKADRFDRQFHLLNGFALGANTDVTVALTNDAARTAIEQFLRDSDSWAFEAATGLAVTDVIDQWQGAPGAYAGPGIAADAYWYGTLRDEGAACEAVERARAIVLTDLDVLHMATAITGVEGVIARGLARKSLPGRGEAETTPLFDSQGNPLPEEKNNGTLREDNSGLYPDYIWEDSCSRDQYVGWALGMAAIWEVIHLDPTFPDELKQRMQEDAAALARTLMIVGESGYDLEIHDADGRLTYHAYLNENALDRLYLDGFRNGMHAAMSLGIVGALAYISGAEDVLRYLYDQLITNRGLHEMVRDDLGIIDVGVKSNYSNYNMGFAGLWMASRYLCGDDTLSAIREGTAPGLYDRPGSDRQPVEQGQTLYDFVYAAARGEATAWAGLHGDVDEAAVGRGVTTLQEFPEPPHWNVPVDNCDETEIASGVCVGLDGTPLDLLGYEGRGDKLVSEQPVPMRIRPRSNYYWRSNPYEVNGDSDGSGLMPGGDFRLVYWMGRWVRRSGR